MADATEILSSVPPEIAGNITFLVNIFRALGVAILVYIIFSLINVLLSRRKEKEIKKINENLEDIKRILKKRRNSNK